MNVIYELIDVTDDATYYTVGVFSSIETATQYLKSHDGVGGTYIHEHNDTHSPPEKAETFNLCRRTVDKPLPQLEYDDTVHVYVRSWEWSDDDSEQVWETKEVIQ